MRRVLLTVHKFFPDHRAGTEVLAFKVGQELQRRGCEVLVVTADPPDLDARHSDGADTGEYVYEGLPVKVFREPLRLRGYTFDHEFFHPGMAEEFAHTLDDFRPDLVHIFHAQNLSGAIIEVARSHKLPVVCSTTDFWFVCPIVQLKLPDGSVCRGPSKGAANCLTCYTPRLFPPVGEFEEALATKYTSLMRVLNLLPRSARSTVVEALFALYKSRKRPEAVKATVKRPAALAELANRMQAIMVPTKLMRDIFIENGISPALIHHVPFGIDTSPLEPFQHKTPSAALRIGFIGTLFEHKGVDLLVQAFQSLPIDVDATLQIFGDLKQFPEYSDQLQRLATSGANAANIKFEGTFPNSQLGSVLQNLDVLVVPSRWYENTPLVMQSALATRTPLIATDLGGMSELVRHEFNGLLCKLNDADSLAQQLLRVIRDRAFLRRLIENIPPERTVSQMVDDIQSIYVAVEQPDKRVTIAQPLVVTGSS